VRGIRFMGENGIVGSGGKGKDPRVPLRKKEGGTRKRTEGKYRSQQTGARPELKACTVKNAAPTEETILSLCLGVAFREDSMGDMSGRKKSFFIGCSTLKGDGTSPSSGPFILLS